MLVSFLKNSIRRFHVVRIDAQLDAAQRVRVEPVHSHHVVVKQKRLDSSRLQRSPRKFGVEQSPNERMTTYSS